MNTKTAAGVVLGLAFVALFVFAILPSPIVWPTAGPTTTGVGLAMWSSRTFEILLQSVILLGGVIAILLLLGSGRTREVAP